MSRFETGLACARAYPTFQWSSWPPSFYPYSLLRYSRVPRVKKLLALLVLLASLCSRVPIQGGQGYELGTLGFSQSAVGLEVEGGQEDHGCQIVYACARDCVNETLGCRFGRIAATG